MTNPKLLRTALYARVSGEHQVVTETIASQLDLLDRRLLADGLIVPPELRFIDEGYTGDTLRRPGLERLRDTAAAGAIDQLYVECPDRLARDYPYQMVLIDELHSQGVEIVFLNYKLETTPEGRLLLQVQGMIAEYERTKIRERCRRGRLFAARSGRVSVLSAAPYGYRYVTKSEGGGEACYVIVLAEAQVVREIFFWVGIEGCSLGQVCKRLKERGVLTQKGRTNWDRATVVGMLRNPAYMGEARFGKERVVPAQPRLRPRRGVPEYPRHHTALQPTDPNEQIPIAVPAIIEPDLFATVQERLAEHKRHPGQTAPRPAHLLSGLVVCKKCGYAYIAHRSGPKAAGKFYYCCLGTDARRFHGQRVCSNPSVQAPLLEEAVWNDVRALLLEPERLAQEFERRLHGDEDTTAVARTRQTLDRQIGQLKRRAARLVEMYADGYIETDKFHNDIDFSKRRLSELEQERQIEREKVGQQKELRLLIGQIEEFAGLVREGLDAGDTATRRRIICALVKQIEVGADQVNIVYKVNPSPFAQAPTGPNVPLCWGRQIGAWRRQPQVTAMAKITAPLSSRAAADRSLEAPAPGCRDGTIRSPASYSTRARERPSSEV